MLPSSRLALLLTLATASTSLASADVKPSQVKPAALTTSTAQSGVYTLRYVALEIDPSGATSSTDAAFPDLVTKRDIFKDEKFALKTTPADFVKLLQGEAPDRTFRVITSGTVPIISENSYPAVINIGPLANDPLQLTLTDQVYISPATASTLVLHSQGNMSLKPVDGSEGGGWDWNGHNDSFNIGRTYFWGGQLKENGAVVTWAFCILPGNLDSNTVASAWKPVHQKSVNIAAVPTTK